MDFMGRMDFMDFMRQLQKSFSRSERPVCHSPGRSACGGLGDNGKIIEPCKGDI